MPRIRGHATILLTAVMAMGLVFAVPREDTEGKAPVPRRSIPPGRSVLQGKIILKGAAPDVARLTKQLREAIESKKDCKEYCLDCAEFEKSQQFYRLGGPDNKQVGNVFVWIAPEPPGRSFLIDDKQLEEAKKQEVAIRQPHCAFIPHCLVLFSRYHDPDNPKALKPTGQVFKIYNDAKISHNTNWTGVARNKGENVMFPAGKERIVDNLVPESTPLSIRCNIHPWMSAWMWIFDHPYATVSLAEPKVKKEDRTFGTYEIPNVPAGKVRLFAWHERIGYLHKGAKKGEPFELKDGAPTVRDFEMEVPKEDQ
jgi:hypothetical protein